MRNYQITDLPDFAQDYVSPSRVFSHTMTSHKEAVLANWKERVGEEEADRIRDEAIERGKQIHLYAEEFCLENKVNPTFEGTDLHYFLQEFTPLAIESWIYNPEKQYKGIYDFLGSKDTPNTFLSRELTVKGVERKRLSEWLDKIQGQKVIIDWKTTTKKKKKGYVIDQLQQVSLYVKGFNYLFNENITSGLLLYLNANMDILQSFAVNSQQINRYYNAFLKRLQHYHFGDYRERYDNY